VKAVILGKSNSRRITLKNYKPFYGEMSLTDILLEKLVKCLDRKDIFLSCEDAAASAVADKWGIEFIHRDIKYTLIDTNTVDVVRGVCKDIPGDDDILYCSCMDPLFDDYENMLRIWEDVRDTHDSLNVVYPMKKYFLDSNHSPIGFGFGHWHKYSQFIPPVYQISWANEILTRECIDRIGYMVGENPYWYDAYNATVDIDTESDWELAQAIYSYYRDKKCGETSE
jgi:N-acylneuraminate cytidylyltransferase